MTIEYTHTTTIATAMIADYNTGYCSCHNNSDTCGVHRLTASDAWDRAYEAFTIAHHDDAEDIHEAASEFADSHAS